MTKHATMDLLVYDNFEVNPVRAVNEEGRALYPHERTKIDFMEQCDPTDVDIFCWSVYGHIPQQGVLCLVDCPDENTANYIARLLSEEREVQRAKAWNKK
jgi:hypothetical protein